VNTNFCATCKFWESAADSRNIDEQAECNLLQVLSVSTLPRNARIFTEANFSCLHHERLARVCDIGETRTPWSEGYVRRDGI